MIYLKTVTDIKLEDDGAVGEEQSIGAGQINTGKDSNKSVFLSGCAELVVSSSVTEAILTLPHFKSSGFLSVPQIARSFSPKDLTHAMIYDGNILIPPS